MMQRSDQLLTRATLFKDVWHYKFVPETNLVDVHMGRLRRKIDGSNEASMIRNIRGEGFILTAIPSRKVHRRDLLNKSTHSAAGDESPRSVEGHCNDNR
jgi:DNA-binding winged helix-turn-helix (wHTH) protein